MTATGNLVIDANSTDTTHTALVFWRYGVGWVVECHSCTYGAWNYQRCGAVDNARAHLSITHGAL